MYSSAFCSVGLQAYNLKSSNLSLDEVFQFFPFFVRSVFERFCKICLVTRDRLELWSKFNDISKNYLIGIVKYTIN
jgi:hypothetical protein